MTEIGRESWKVKETRRGSKILGIKCPLCGGEFDVEKYRIDKDGKMWPSACCPRLECSFAQFVTLCDWGKVEDAVQG